MMDNMENILLGIGNPLLDISAHVGEELLTKYDLKRSNAIMAEPKHLPLYEELTREHKVQYIAGGAAQNSIRAAQWMLQIPGATSYIGCVGKDHFGDKLEEVATQDGVKVHYLRDEAESTGTCAVLITNKDRSLVANLAAAQCYKKEHLSAPAIQSVIDQARFYYTTGYFLPVSTEAVEFLGRHAIDNGKTLLFNVAAPFVVDVFEEQLRRVLPYADVVFANEHEAAALGKKFGWGEEDLPTVALKLAAMPRADSARQGPRMVVFTQGARSTLVAVNGTVREYHPIPVPESEIVDLNGAGDSFVGGFLSQFVQDPKAIDRAVAAAHYCACCTIKTSGTSFTSKAKFEYSGETGTIITTEEARN